MNILMIAPEPFFQTRGTPFSVRDRCRCLTELGHRVDLVTYSMGEDICFPGMVIHRTRRIPGIHHVRIGFSWAKIPLDIMLFIKAFQLLRRGNYHLIHTHEEAGMMGAIFRRIFKIPHLYDMHSSLPQQFKNYGTSSAGPVLAFMKWAERVMLKGSDAVIAICPHLEEVVRTAVPQVKVTIIENLAQGADRDPDAAEVRRLKEMYGLTEAFVFGYTGTFEVNQGLEWVIDGFASVSQDMPDAVLFLVGGDREQIKRLEAKCDAEGISNKVKFPGKLAPDMMPDVMAVCDVLMSPRRIGTNTPLKLYSYLRSGKPILATRMLTHTQVLDDTTAVLVDPSPEGLAEGMLRLYNDSNLRKTLGAAARRLEKTRYSYPAYRKKVAELMLEIETKSRIESDLYSSEES